MDIEGHIDDPKVREAIEEVESLYRQGKVIGSYPAADLERLHPNFFEENVWKKDVSIGDESVSGEIVGQDHPHDEIWFANRPTLGRFGPVLVRFIG